ncbi:MAG TPA: hypothetical protein DEO93_08540 [Stenotrophomonas sp.]|nr:hypothetical protein [Stenotrophomonas sp.]
MSTSTLKNKGDIRNFADKVMRELQERQTSQSFNGSLKVHYDRVVVNEMDGRRAINKLKQRLAQHK